MFYNGAIIGYIFLAGKVLCALKSKILFEVLHYHFLNREKKTIYHICVENENENWHLLIQQMNINTAHKTKSKYDT